MTEILPALTASSAFWLGGSLLMGYAEATKRENPYYSGTVGLALVVSGAAGAASVVGGALLVKMGMLIAFPLWVGLVAGGIFVGGFWIAPLLARIVSDPDPFMIREAQ